MIGIQANRCVVAWAFAGIALATVNPAGAQDLGARSTCSDNRSTRQLFTGAVRDIGRVPSTGSVGILALGGAAALGAHTVDTRVDRSFSTRGGLDGTFSAGATLGGTPLQLGAAFTTYAIGRAMNKP